MDLPAPILSPPLGLSAELGSFPSDLQRSRDLARIKIIATALLAFSVVVGHVAEAPMTALQQPGDQGAMKPSSATLPSPMPAERSRRGRRRLSTSVSTPIRAMSNIGTD